MRFMVDQNLGVKFANVLDALCESAHSVHHLSTLGHLGLNIMSPDEEWMRVLAAQADQWAVFTTDRGIIRSTEMAAVLRESKLTYFIALKNWKGVSIPERVARIARLWPKILEFALLPEPAIYKISPAIMKMKMKVERASWTATHKTW